MSKRLAKVQGDSNARVINEITVNVQLSETPILIHMYYNFYENGRFYRKCYNMNGNFISNVTCMKRIYMKYNLCERVIILNVIISEIII